MTYDADVLQTSSSELEELQSVLTEYLTDPIAADSDKDAARLAWDELCDLEDSAYGPYCVNVAVICSLSGLTY